MDQSPEQSNQVQSPDQSSQTQAPTQSNTSIKSSTIGWAVAAVIFSIFALVFNDSPLVLRAGFFGKFFAFILGAFGGWLGAMIGNAIREYALPDSFFTTGGMGSIIKTKLFWAVGPQLIGLVIGSLIGISIVLS